MPYYDFKNAFSVGITISFSNGILKTLLIVGGIGLFILVWGIVLTFGGRTRNGFIFFGKMVLSWVCGCGGLGKP